MADFSLFQFENFSTLPAILSKTTHAMTVKLGTKLRGMIFNHF
jgi:hypothetical protein